MLNLFVGLDIYTGLLLLLALAFVLFYEAINGFHDTANAVATVIYTRAMQPQLAVVMAAFFNFFGVLLGGLSVAYAIVHMLPTDLLLNMGSTHGLAMVFSMLLAAIIWNLGTWFFGLPASSSHTLIGAIIGIGLTNALLTGSSVMDALNLREVTKIFSSLIVSPIVGLVIAGGLIFLLRRYWSGTKKRDRIHRIPEDRKKKKGKRKPPFWTRIALIVSAAGVAFSHGANDGQKGIGLVMLVLVGIAPAGFVVNMNASGYEITRNRTEEVIPLDNASASEIARVLESLTKNSGENQPATLKSQIVADERTNSVIVSGDPATRDKMRRLIRRLDSEMERSGNSQVFYLKYSKAEDLVDVLKQVSGTLTAAKEEAEGTVGSGREIVSIAASKHSNALIVTAPQDIMQSLQSVIEQLDIRRAQVHVEALIVEVAEGSNINFGVQWASKDAGLMQFANGTQIPIGTLGAAISQAKPQKGSTVISENGATTINPDTNGDLSTLAQLLSGFSGTAVGVVKGDWMALVQAVKNDSSSNVLSTPSITTLDNQEAFFMVGQDVPVLTGSTVGSNNSNPFNTVERKKVGIMLKVTPQINEGNAVQMVIEQEVSKVEGQTSLDVVFGERKLKTTVLANDGELIVLGGLMDDQAGESVAKVPLLGDIPLIGNLFKSTADKKEKRNLMVFIRPTILRDGMAADGVSQRKYNYMRAEQIYRDEQGLSLMPHTAQPVLPAQNQALPPEVRAFLNAGRTR